MIPDLKPYPAMKDSGVEWLGEVPEHWDVLPNRTFFADKVKERGHPAEQMLSVTITEGRHPAANTFGRQFEEGQLEPGQVRLQARPA